MLKVSDVSLLILFSFGSFIGSIEAFEEDCIDYFGNIIIHGHFYVPGPSVCTSCVCYHSKSLWCKAIYCDPPYYCKKFRIGERCCEFHCLDPPEEIMLEKERLRKKKKFLGITYGAGTRITPTVLSLIVAVTLFSLDKIYGIG